MERRQLPVEFKEFIQCLNKHDVKYLLVGGWAVSLHGHPRFTKDIDFMLSNDQENIKKFKKAYLEYKGPPADFEKFKEKGYVIKFGNSPMQIDVINEASGIDFNECYKKRIYYEYNDINICVISIDDLIINKKASARNNDLGDVSSLEKIIEYEKQNNNVTEMNCIKYYEIVNDTVKNEIKNIVELDDYTDYDNKKRIYKEIKKYRHTRRKHYYILQGLEKINNIETRACVWHFNKDFNKKSALNFIEQYDQKKYSKKNGGISRSQGKDRVK